MSSAEEDIAIGTDPTDETGASMISALRARWRALNAEMGQTGIAMRRWQFAHKYMTDVAETFASTCNDMYWAGICNRVKNHRSKKMGGKE